MLAQPRWKEGNERPHRSMWEHGVRLVRVSALQQSRMNPAFPSIFFDVSRIRQIIQQV